MRETLEMEKRETEREARSEAERLEDEDTAELVVRFQAGEVEAFGAIYQRYFDRVYAYLKLLLKDRHEAEDATQQTLMQVFEALPRYEQRRQPFRAWLFTIARHCAIRYFDQGKRMDVWEPEEVEGRRERELVAEGAEDVVVPGWISDKDLVVFVGLLPIPQRQALVLRHVLGLGNAEVAQIMGRGAVDVRVLQHRALVFLRERMISIGRGPKEVPESKSTPELEPMRRWPKQAPVLRYRRHALM